MFKKKCLVCGAKNSKERMVCIECGAPLASEQLKTQLSHVSAEVEVQVKSTIEKEPEERIGDEYRDNEKVLYKTRGKLSLSHNKPEEVDCIVTGNHVVIEAGEPLKIPLPRVIGCQVDTTIPDYSSYRPYSTQTQESTPGTATLTFLDDQNSKHELLLKGHALYLLSFKRAIDKQIVGRFGGITEEHRRDETSGEFLSGIEETFRDHTRGDICASLQRWGIDAQMAPRGRPEEEVYTKGSPRMGSLGIIHIPEGPIRWVNVRKETHSRGELGSVTYYYTEYGVPDPRLGPNSPGARIETVRVKASPLFGRVVDLRWKGWGSDLGIISRLNSDNQLKQPLMKSGGVLIRSIRDYGCWIILPEMHGIPSEELWNCYQVIAQHLLADWSSG